MALVGLFWITEDCVYVGAEPVGAATGVRLTEDGVEALGLGRGESWRWDRVRRIEVRDVAVRSAARRLVSVAFDNLMVMVTGDGELPPAFTVCVDAADGPVEVSVVSAVTGGVYTPAEYELSRALLTRLTDGSTPVGELLAWRRDHGTGGTPSRAEREALLRKWTGDDRV
ncbi:MULTISPECIES: hypothetical protein [Streptomyces]|uniref:PH domain-containing protein n=2 Tax=Streptomyces TaxID=1883 RepID=A0ABT9LN57_STRGD|nr:MULTISPECIES: hypothetical protein [Streptomyces]MDP9684960.1 hypothetical protein [Streptomyces griseoviridis]GGT17945.1 hypothetical protein GCM10010240_58910 [Streptomyces griseoviridis]GGU46247.1 hypothetical protein GCM10010259_41310 [Streptomyces daghestanicus]GHI33564.1 hypothetical protein Sdagh_52940 [Streptomyces daghestanicus]